MNRSAHFNNFKIPINIDVKKKLHAYNFNIHFVKFAHLVCKLLTPVFHWYSKSNALQGIIMSFAR